MIPRRATAAAVALMMAGCAGESSEAGAIGALRFPPARYPQTIRTVAGIAATDDLTRNDVTAATDRRKLANDGFHWVRLDASWDKIESAPGVYRFDAFDPLIDDLNAAGLEPILILLYGNPLYPAVIEPCRAFEAENRCPPADLDAFSAYARATAAHFAGRVTTFEVWNEANGWFRFWPTRHGGDPAEYARMISQTAAVVHDACPDCRVLTGGLVYLDFPPVVLGQDKFFAQMLAAVPDLFARVEGIGFHHYTFYPPVQSPENDDFPEVALEKMLRNTRVACNCDLPIWITETGWTMSGGLSQTNQARFGLRAFLIALTAGVRSWLWWSHRDYVRDDLIATQEANFGLWRADGTPKPVYQGLARLLAEFGDATTVRDARDDYGLTSPSEWAVELSGPSGRTVIVWADTKTTARTIEALAGKTAVELISGDTAPFTRLIADPQAIRLD